MLVAISDDAVSADIRLETEDDEHSASYCPTSLPPSTYHPRRALHIALQDWLLEFRNSVLSTGPIIQPQILTPVPIVPSVNTCMSLTTTTPVPPTLPTLVNSVNQVAEVIQDVMNGIATSAVVMNSLVSETKIDTLLPEQLPEAVANNIASRENGSSNASSAEPMECNHSPDPSPSLSNNTTADTNVDNTEEQMVVEQSKPDSPPSDAANIDVKTPSPKEEPPVSEELQLTIDDLHLLADLFYLPFEHGKKGINLMTEFNWLKSNSQLVIEHNRNNPDGTRKPEVSYCYMYIFFYAFLFIK